MNFALACHSVEDLAFGESTRLDGSSLAVSKGELCELLLDDDTLASVDLEIVSPSEQCRVGPVFDIIEPRAKENGGSPDFPGILGPPATAGVGTTHVLKGMAVTVLDAGGATGASRGTLGRVLEMSGAPAEASLYAQLRHLVVVPHPKPGYERHTAQRANRVCGLKAAVYLARATQGRTPDGVVRYDAVGPALSGREGLPRVAYVGQIFSRQRRAEIDEPVLYGANTIGMLPVLLHPDEWLDGAVVTSYYTSMGGAETYCYQNHPIITELYRRHQARELNFVGTVATVAGADNTDRELNCRAAAHLVRWALRADAAVLTKYGGGVPHADLAETARLLEGMNIRTAVMVSDVSRDRRVESALLFNFPEVNAIVYGGGNDTHWTVGPVERVVAGSPAMSELLAGARELSAVNVVGVANQQGVSKLRAVVY